jgi:hypothetical protein
MERTVLALGRVELGIKLLKVGAAAATIGWIFAVVGYVWAALDAIDSSGESFFPSVVGSSQGVPDVVQVLSAAAAPTSLLVAAVLGWGLACLLDLKVAAGWDAIPDGDLDRLAADGDDG